MSETEDTERLPCPVCGELSAVAAQMCLHCGSSQLVDVVLRARVDDPRTRYRVARALHAVPGAPSLGEIQAALTGSPPAAARGVTRAFAHEALGVLSQNGLNGSLERTPEKGASGGGGGAFGTILKSVAAILVLAMGWVAWQKVLGPDEKPAPRASVEAGGEAASKPPAEAALSPRRVAELALPATVSLRCRESVGSGFFVAEDLVVTNAHVLCPPGESIQVVLSDQRQLPGEVDSSDPDLDLALVRVPGAAGRALALGDVGDIAVGDRVMIVGSPVGLDFTVQEGSISSLQRAAFGFAYIQLDAKISPGNSGGPVVDSRARVVGIVSMKVVGEGIEGIGLAIPINYVYDGTHRFVDAPSPRAASSAGFARMVASAREASGSGSTFARANDPGSAFESDASEEASEIEGYPLLVAGYVDQYQRLVVRIMRATDYAPGYEEVEVTLWSGGESFCSVKGDVNDWKQVDLAAGGHGLDARAVAILQRVAPGRTFFVGESPLRWDLCDRSRMRSGIEIHLEGAGPIANRLLVR